MKKISKIPIIMFSSIVPLVMFAKVYRLSPEMDMVYKGSKMFVDFFSYYKMLAIILSFILGIIIFIKDKGNKSPLIKNWINRLLLFFAVLTIFSSIFGGYTYISIFGFVDRFEGLFVQLGYVFFVFYINNFVNTKEDVEAIIFGLMISSTIIAIIGISEFYGHNLLATTIGRKMITPISMHDSLDKINFAIKGKSFSSTLYNSNFVGSYMVLMTYIGYYKVFTSKKIEELVISLIYLSMMIFSLVASNSSAGKVGIISSIILLIVVMGKRRFNKRISIVLITSIIMFISLPNVLELDSSISNELSKEINISKTDREEFNFILEDKEVIYTYGESQLKIEIRNGKIFFFKNGDKLRTRQEKNMILIYDQEISEKFKVQIANESNALCISYKNDFVVFLKFTENGYQLLDNNMRPIEYQRNFRTFSYLEGKENMGSSRGYIWKMSIPLLLDYPIIGSGADTYPAVYPQNDILGKYIHMNKPYAYVDKPHNMYIQIGIQSGLLSLGIYILALLLYGIQSIQLYLNNKNDESTDILGICLICAVFGYSVTGFFNDSVVSVAPVYWTVLGLGLAVNRIKSNRLKEI